MHDVTSRGVNRSSFNAKAPRLDPVAPSAVDVPLPSTPELGKTPSFQSDSPRASTSAENSPRTPSKKIERDHRINRDALSLVLLFNGPGGPSIQNTEDTAPPAFFPQQRVSFSPRLRIANRSGLALAGPHEDGDVSDREQICSMLLGVTGIVETLGHDRQVKTRRIVADFRTDLTTGVHIWRKDAEACLAKRRRAQGVPARGSERSSALPMGTYVLPLSMRIPACHKLPPSCENTHFRLRYLMSLALLSTIGSESNAVPRIVKVATVPFHILPSTLPTLPPTLPTLSHEERRSVASIMSGLYRSLSLARSSSTDSLPPPTTHTIVPSLPTSHFSPGSIIPLTLRIKSKPLPLNSDLYIRTSLVRKIFVREAATSIEEDDPFDLPDDTLWEQWCRAEDTVVSRWGYVPSEHRIGRLQASDKPSNSEVKMRDIILPLGNDVSGWHHGYSSSLDLAPAGRQTIDYDKGSWFSAAVREVVEKHAKDTERHLHVSTRFFVKVDVGFHTATPSAPARLVDMFAERQTSDPTFVVPAPSTFTPASFGPIDPFSEEIATSTSLPDLSSPRPKSTNAGWGNSPTTLSSAIFGRSSPHAFPGTMRTLLLPIVIGSVAEPTMQCVTGRWVSDAATNDGTRHAHPADREEIEETPVERLERIGDDGEEAWLVPPPSFSSSLRAPPAYLGITKGKWHDDDNPTPSVLLFSARPMTGASPWSFSYNDIHETIARVSETLKLEFRPDLIIAIGGGGFIPARILRSFLKSPDHKNVPIQAIGLSLYEELGSFTTAEKIGKEVIRTQWLDFSALAGHRLLGKRILIVDEVDDSRTTLAYAVAELQKDVKDQLSKLTPDERAAIKPTEFAIFVVHNKVRPKLAELPPDVRYYTGLDVPSINGEPPWIDYPWEQKDIVAHDKRAASRPQLLETNGK